MPTDLPLLSSTVDVLKPLAGSPNAGPIYRTCSKLYEAAQSLVPSHLTFDCGMPQHPSTEGRPEVIHEDAGAGLGSVELGLLTNNLDSALAHDWSTFIDLFGGQDEGGSFFAQ